MDRILGLEAIGKEDGGAAVCAVQRRADEPPKRLGSRIRHRLLAH